MKKISDAVANWIAKITKFNTLKTKVNSLEKNPDPTTLIHINQCHTDGQSLEKKNWRCW